LGSEKIQTGGGILVQKIVWSRVSGVLQTVNTAKNELREMIINAGLGMGEGIVSGLVGTDQITVLKNFIPGKYPLRFSYITNDKRECIAFDKHSGHGTILTETLYHQRLRAALEYVEIEELVRIALNLENAYGYPLDIEFGIEGTKLWILQARPVATFLATYQNTLEYYPLKAKTRLN
jgi:pyruvate,water dikinase